MRGRKGIERNLGLTLTYWFSSIFFPLSRSIPPMVSRSIVSTWILSVVRTRLLVEDPVADSVCTFRIVVPGKGFVV